MTLAEFGGERPHPEVSGVVAETEEEDFNNQNHIPEVQPQGTTRRPHANLPSIQDLATTTPAPSPFLDHFPNTVPGTNLECGVTKIPQGRVVGGNTTFEGEHPWMAAIYLHGNGRSEFWCGGVLVSPNVVITAAHCTKDAKKRP